MYQHWPGGRLKPGGGLFRIVVETTLLPETEDTAARFHLVDRTIALQLDFEHDFRGNDLAVRWEIADFEDSLLNE